MKILISEDQLKKVKRHIITERYSVVDELLLLSIELTEIISRKNNIIYHLYNHYNESGVLVDDFFDYKFSVTLLSEIKNIDKYQKIGKFIIDNKSTKILFYIDSNDDAGGLYDDKKKIIYLNALYINTDENIELIENLDYEDRYGTNELNEDLFISTFTSSLLHELRHHYDSYISKGKYDSDKKSIKYYDNREKGVENLDLYYRLPHEYWARLTQFIADYKSYFYGRKFNDILFYLKNDEHFNFGKLTEKDKKKIINTLYRLWDEMNDDLKKRMDKETFIS